MTNVKIIPDLGLVRSAADSIGIDVDLGAFYHDRKNIPEDGPGALHFCSRVGRKLI
ncbi:MAG: hypothetical protein GDA38_08355 [Hormoscilla sp. SP12CHS1]|nr:hypothetical protein [Hormoscilla sp. SP12CHS1]